MELGAPSFEKQGLSHLQQGERREYSEDDFEEIGNELQICIVLFEGSDMMSWITNDSENFRTWLKREEGRSALEDYLSGYPFDKIHSRGERIVAQYEHPENLRSLLTDDVTLPAFVAAFRKAYPRLTAHDTEIPSGETIH